MDILKKLQQLGETYSVGGCVRDMILGIEPKDFDIVTKMPMDILEKNFKTHDIGKNKDFGIVVIEYNGNIYEVSQFRSDGIYSDGRRPDSIKLVSTIQEDLARRDFTINAMAFDGKNIIDPFGGQKDLKDKRIRFVRDAKERIEEDNLRVLRAYRFAARFKFQIIDEEKMMAFDLSNISQERVTDEIKKVASYGGKELAFFIHRIISNQIKIPGLIISFCPQQIKYHPEGNVFNHIIHCLSVSNSTDYLTNLCILFHDVGKLETYKEIDGNPTFYGHDNISFEEIGKGFKLSNEEIETIQYVINNHMKWWDLQNMRKSKQLEICLHKDYDRLVDVCYCDEMSRLYLSDFDYWFNNKYNIEKIKINIGNKINLDKRIKNIIDGNIIIKEFSVEGKEVGRLLELAKEKIIEKEFNISQEDLISYLKTQG